MAQNIVKDLQTYIELGYNILLQGDHGTGKTTMLIAAVEALGLTMEYRSASTMDPFTDLVGIPVPRDENGIEVLKNIRPHSIDKAEVLFFDELNRADPKTLNAFFEIVQFRTINGEPLPNLKCVIGAQNPPGSDYNVDSLDPALVDRFHIVMDIAPRPDSNYLTKALNNRKVAIELVSWWNQVYGPRSQVKGAAKQDRKNYLSPRRLETIGRVFLDTVKIGNDGSVSTNQRALEGAMPPGAAIDHGKLKDMLEGAVRVRVAGGSAAAISAAIIKAQPIEIREPDNSPNIILTDVADVWSDLTQEARDKFIGAIRSQKGTTKLVQVYWEVLNKFSFDDWRAMVVSSDKTRVWNDSKLTGLRGIAVNKEQNKNLTQETVENMKKIVSEVRGQ